MAFMATAKMDLKILCLLLCVCLLWPRVIKASDGAGGAFSPSVQAIRQGDIVQVTVEFKIAPGAYIHEDGFGVSVNGVAGKLLTGDKAVLQDGEWVFRKDFTRIYTSAVRIGDGVEVRVSYAGCLDSGVCLMPEEKIYRFDIGESAPAAETAPADAGTGVLGGFEVVSSRVGYQGADEFIQWLDDAVLGRAAPSENLLERVFRRYGLLLAVLLVIPLGALLNLTPCVLPMIPVTLAILGAGGRSQSRRRGLALGLAYGAGMALAYGALGVGVVLTGGQFGSFNSSGWFNGCVAVVFWGLGLSMFDVFVLDLSRFRRARLPGAAGSGRLAGAFGMGALSAILAGACIAPVLIWVLVLSADLYSGGEAIGLILPFMLGIGMALPWPMLGAGLSMLPRPGRWMVRIRQTFGVLIMLLGVYYGVVAARQFSFTSPAAAADGWRTDFRNALALAENEQKPVLVDFWGVSCKNCVLMDSQVLSRPDVQKRLEAFVCVKLRGDDTADAVVAGVMRSLGVKGFPTYVVLKRGKLQN